MKATRLRLFMILSMVEAPANTKHTLLSSEGCKDIPPMFTQHFAP